MKDPLWRRAGEGPGTLRFRSTGREALPPAALTAPAANEWQGERCARSGDSTSDPCPGLAEGARVPGGGASARGGAGAQGPRGGGKASQSKYGEIRAGSLPFPVTPVQGSFHREAAPSIHHCD